MTINNVLLIFFNSSENLVCPHHEERSLEFFDEDLKKPVCAMCIISDTCKGHSIIPLSKVVSLPFEIVYFVIPYLMPLNK